MAEIERNGFELIWQVRNLLIHPGIDRDASWCTFRVESLYKSEFTLTIQNHGLQLMATLQYKRTSTLTLKCNVFVLFVGKSVQPFSRENIQDLTCSNVQFIIQSDCSTLFQKQKEFLYCDSVTVCCHLIPVEINLPHPLIYFALSTIKLIPKRFTVVVNDFSSLNQARIYRIARLGFFYTELSISVYEDLSFEITLDKVVDEGFVFLDYVFLMDVDGMATRVWDRRVHVIKSFLVPSSVINFKCKDKKRFIKNDQLTLHFEISGSRLSPATIEGEVVGMTSAQNQDYIARFFNQYQSQIIQFPPTEVAIQENAPNSISNDMQNLLLERTLTDFELRFPGNSIHAHKAVLCARSSVFKAMLTTDMKESASNCVDIEEDMDAATMQHLVNFMYSDSFPSLDWDSTVKLYAAADKYDVLQLKQGCSKFLSSNLSVENVCSLLYLADRHSDEDLRSTVHSFMYEYEEPIMDSQEWKLFLKNDTKLASETMYSLYQIRTKTALKC